MRLHRAVAAAALAALAIPAAASAHAVVSPVVVEAKQLQFFTLSVPTEKENATTTSIELTPPSGFTIDSFQPSPGWKRDVQSTGSGEEAAVTKVTWSGGKVPTEEDALFVPESAWAHAALLRTSPSASVVVSSPPARVLLTYSEAVEPRFAIVSVTDALGHQVTAGPPTRSASSADTLFVPLERVGQGWYLVYWRVISADGHPVRGAFTFAVGPSPGPPPQFQVPSLSETAHTPQLLIARWVVFLSFLSALGLFVLRMLIARPVGRSLRGIS